MILGKVQKSKIILDEKLLEKYVDSVIRETKKEYTLKKELAIRKVVLKSPIRKFSLMY